MHYSYDGDEASKKPATSAVIDTTPEYADSEKSPPQVSQPYQSLDVGDNEPTAAQAYRGNPEIDDSGGQNDTSLAEALASELLSEAVGSPDANGIGIKEDG